MKKRYGVVLIGCGHIGEQHLEDIYFRETIKIVATVDNDEERARLFAAKYGADHYGTEYIPYLTLAETDIVIIATYADSHLSIMEDCLRYQKHVLCEKPITPDVQSGRKFYELVKNAKTKVLIAHILRHNKSYQAIADLIHNGAIGDLKLIRMVQNHHTMNWPRYQRLLEVCPPIVDCGVHYIDIMQWFSGSRVVEVSGMGCKLDADAAQDNYGMIHIKMANGCIGYYEAGWSKNLASQNIKEFIGDKGRISLLLRENRSQDREEGDLITVYTNNRGDYQSINIQSKYKDMYAQLSTLIDMIEQNIPANPSIDEVFSAFYIALEADKAIKNGTRLAIQPMGELQENRRNYNSKPYLIKENHHETDQFFDKQIC
ncbi:MAG: Gfo/Idh/MocA family oxidoreductase [Oscillospiraceae bacterium]|nr:Gfo/Idh/MocA family oxidoreductase [Oscillospiraceae bacterium]MDD4413101.1 Gfo/Idh/MocA family oxidoreductase [Oscillospiraceae bacterium]